MPTYRYPVLVWEDGEGYFNACPVETDEPVGLGRTTSEALRQVEEGLAWSFENGGQPTPDWDEPSLGRFRLSIRPQGRGASVGHTGLGQRREPSR